MIAVKDVDRKTSNIILAHAALSAGLHLAASARTRGVRCAAVFFALGAGLPAVGEALATGPLGLLRHRTRPRIAGAPIGVLLGWYGVIHGSFTVAERVLARLPLSRATRRRALPAGAALVGTGLDLILDPFGLDAGLWEWNADGAYASGLRGANGHWGVPLINYLGWLTLVAGVVFAYGKLCTDEEPANTNRLPQLLLLPYYAAPLAWSAKKRKLRYALYSLPFAVALYTALKES